MKTWNDGAVMIDGVAYVSAGNDIVELVPKKVDCKIGTEVITFVENGEYDNSFGSCLIHLIREDGTMDVEYLKVKNSLVSVGEWKNYPVSAQALTIANERRREVANEAFNGVKSFKERMTEIRSMTLPEVDVYSMGVLAVKGNFQIQSHENISDHVASEYKVVTGEVLHHPDQGNSNWTISGNYRGHALGVTFAKTSPKVLGKIKLPNISICKNGTVSFWNIHLIWSLFANGFRVGKNDDRLDEIASRLSEKDMDQFWAGVNEARGADIAA